MTLKPSVCDCNDWYILEKGTITVVGKGAYAAAIVAVEAITM